MRCPYICDGIDGCELRTHKIVRIILIVHSIKDVEYVAADGIRYLIQSFDCWIPIKNLPDKFTS